MLYYILIPVHVRKLPALTSLEQMKLCYLVHNCAQYFYLKDICNMSAIYIYRNNTSLISQCVNKHNIGRTETSINSKIGKRKTITIDKRTERETSINQQNQKQKQAQQ